MTNIKSNNNNSNNNNNNSDLKSETLQQCQKLIDNLCPKLSELQGIEQQYWVGVAGGPGSGKSTIASYVSEQLNKIMPDSTVVVPMDGWHTPKKELMEKFGGEDAMLRRGAPHTFDVDLCIRELTEAKRRGSASLPIYSRDISDPVPDGIQLKTSHQIVLVEGIYLLWKDDEKCGWGNIPDDLWDEQWFVKCPSQEEQVDRLVQRSLKTWNDAKTELWGGGTAEEAALRRAEKNDIPNLKVVEHCSKYADHVIVTY